MGFVKDALGAIGNVPVLGDVAKVAAPVAGGIFGGPLGASAGGAISKIMGGSSSPGDILGGAATAGAGASLIDSFMQQRQDSQRARDLVNESVGMSRGASDIGIQQFNRDAPLRQGFRSGAMNFFDPTNPFSTNVAQGNMSFGGQSTPTRPAGSIGRAVESTLGGVDRSRRGRGGGSGMRGSDNRRPGRIASALVNRRMA